MNKKIRNFGILQAIWGGILLVTHLIQTGIASVDFFLLFLFILAILLPEAILVRKKVNRLSILYFTGFGLYFVGLALIDPGVFWNASGVSLFTFLPTMLFVVLPLYYFQENQKFNQRLLTKWYHFRFYLILGSQLFLMVILMSFFLPNNRDFAATMFSLSAILMGPMLMLMVGYSSFELFADVDFFTDLREYRFEIGLNIILWLFFSLNMIFGASLGMWVPIGLVVLELVLSITVFFSRKTPRTVYHNLMEYHPFRPNKNWLNKFFSSLFIVSSLVFSIVVIIIILLAAQSLILVDPLVGAVGFYDFTLAIDSQSDPFILIYFITGYFMNFVQIILEKEEKVFSEFMTPP